MTLPGKPISVLVADDHPATRAGIRGVLDNDAFSLCAEVGDADSAVAAARRELPDLCLIAVGIGGGGIAAVGAIREHVPAATIVMLAARLNEDELFEALRAGADGYLLKDTDPARLPFVLAGAVAGEAALPRKLAARVIDEFRGHEARRRLLLGAQHAVTLTAREWEVLEALRERTSTAEIASRLSVSPVTVRRHVSGIVRKLRVPDREAAIRLLESRRELRHAERASGIA